MKKILLLCMLFALAAHASAQQGPQNTGRTNAGQSISTSGNARIGGGDPWIDITAPPYNAKGDGSTDDTAAIQAAINVVSATGGTVFCPPGPGGGVYALKGATLTLNSGHVKFLMDPKCTLQAQTGFSGVWMLTVGASATDDYIGGGMGVWDGNNVAAGAVILTAGATRITFDRNEVKNMTTGASGAFQFGNGENLSPLAAVKVTNNNFHNIVNSAVWVFQNADLTVDDNIFTSVASGANEPAVTRIGLTYGEAKRNRFTNSSNGDGCLESFAGDAIDDTDNYFSGCSQAVHEDTVARGTLARNISSGATNSGTADYFVEASSNVTVDNNTSINPAGSAIVLGTGSLAQQYTDFRTQLQSFDSTTGFVAASHVTLTTDTSDKQEGTGSMVATADGSFTTGPLFTYTFGSNQSIVWGYFDIWVKPTSGFMAYNQLQLILSKSSACATSDLIIPMFPASQNNWSHFSQYGANWKTTVGTVTLKSFCVSVRTSTPSIVVKFDNLQVAAEQVGNTVSENRAFNVGSIGIQVDVQQGAVIRGNFVQDAGQANGLAAYYIANSSGTIFDSNRSFWTMLLTLPSGPNATHLTVDANKTATNVQLVNDNPSTSAGVMSNATVAYSFVSGGTITGNPTGATTCTFTSGGGTSPSCAVNTGSTSALGSITLTTGTGSPGSSGTFTLTFPYNFGINAPSCAWTLSNASAGQWNIRATVIDKTPSVASDLVNWDNNGSSLGTSTAFQANYSCGAH